MLADIVQCARQHALKMIDRPSFGADYARTRKLWRGAILASVDAACEQQFDERSIRLWDFYRC